MKIKFTIFISIIIFVVVFFGAHGNAPWKTEASGLPILKPSDFTYLGSFRIPSEPDESFSRGALAARKVNGHLQFFTNGSNAGAPTIEFLDPESYSLDAPTAPIAPLIKSWGNIYGDKIQDNTGASAFSHPGLGVDFPALLYHDDKLYFTYVDNYSCGYTWPSLGMFDLQTGLTYGPWGMSPSAASTGKYLTELPDGTIGAGSGIFCFNSSGSWGPELYGGMTFPTASTPTFLQSGTRLAMPYTYARYPYNPAYFQSNGTLTPGAPQTTLLRPGNYNWYPTNPEFKLDPLKNNGVGSFDEIDNVYSASWINLPDKQGVVFTGRIGTGDLWYGGTELSPTPGVTDHCWGGQGPHAQGFDARWWIYDPATLNQVKNGAINSWEAKPAYEFDPTVAIHSFQMKCSKDFGSGMYFDPDTRKLYVTAREGDISRPYRYLELVHVFFVNGAGFTPPTPVPSPAPSPNPTPNPSPSPASPSAPLDIINDISGYSWCAADNQTCSFTGTKYVAWGANGSYIRRTITGSVTCSNDSFSGDPTPNVLKACYVKDISLPSIVGDFDHNGIVNSLDWSYMNSKWFTADATADLNHDGIVNSLDFSILNKNWLKTS